MANTTKTAAASLVIIATVLADAQEQAQGRPALFVHIENRAAAVLPETLADARAELAHIYEDAGVTVESSAEADHTRCARQLTVHVVLLAGTMADRFIENEDVKRGVIAQAYGESRQIYVFSERVAAAVNRHAIAHGDALGLVIAHELGHVLLPRRGHSLNGIMRANYDVFLSYRLKFSADESAAMRAFITARADLIRKTIR